MDLEKLTRELGAAIQQDKVYLDFAAARKANDEDEELNALMGKIRLIQLSYQQEASKETQTSGIILKAKTERRDSLLIRVQQCRMSRKRLAELAVSWLLPFWTRSMRMQKIPIPKR